MQPLVWDKWADFASLNYSFTIDDVLNLKPAVQVKLLWLGGPVWDGVLDCNPIGTISRPEEFFSDSWAIYVHEKDLEGKIFFWYEFGLNDPAFDPNTGLINMDYVNKNSDRYCFPQFHIEIEAGCWHPLENGYLLVIDHGDSVNIGQYFLPPTTHLGFGGPFIKWDNLKMLPDVSYPFPKETIEAFELPKHLTEERNFNIQISDYPPFNSYLISDTYSESKFALWRVRRAIEAYLIQNKIQDTIKYTVIVSEFTKNSKYKIYKYLIEHMCVIPEKSKKIKSKSLSGSELKPQAKDKLRSDLKLISGLESNIISESNIDYESDESCESGSESSTESEDDSSQKTYGCFLILSAP